MSKEAEIIVFTDGACTGNPGQGGWGAIVSLPSGKIFELGSGAKSTTNNRMEMTAALEALRSIAGENSPVKIYTDSQYLIQGITGWIYGWQKSGWKTAAGEEVQNRDLWQELFAVYQAQKAHAVITWQHVPGHSKIPANERCDKIAQGFASGKNINLYSGPAAKYSVDLSIPNNLAERAAWRSKLKKGHGYYLSYVNGQIARHETWAECEARVKGKPGAKFKKCAAPEAEAEILQAWGAKSDD